MAIPSDATLFKQYCLRAQGVVAPSALEVMPAVTPTGASSVSTSSDGGGGGGGGGSGGGGGGVVAGGPVTILAGPMMHTTAERLAATNPTRFEYHPSNWRTFPDGR